MLEAARRAWAASGRPVDRLRFETFGASGEYPPAPFTVKIPRLDREIRVAANQAMLEALEAAGIEMIFDCRRGESGLCALPILELDGVVDHRDVFFSQAEKAESAKLCTCVSRVYGRAITVDTADRRAEVTAGRRGKWLAPAGSPRRFRRGRTGAMEQGKFPALQRICREFGLFPESLCRKGL